MLWGFAGLWLTTVSSYRRVRLPHMLCCCRKHGCVEASYAEAEMLILHLAVSILHPLSRTSANTLSSCSTVPAYEDLLPQGFDGSAL